MSGEITSKLHVNEGDKGLPHFVMLLIIAHYESTHPTQKEHVIEITILTRLI